MNLKYQIYNNFTLSELEKKLKTSNEHDVALFLSIHKDRKGRYFSFIKDLPMLTELSKIPIYGMWGVLNGKGVIGGYMTDAKIHGEEIAKHTTSYLNGTKIKDLPIIEKTKFVPQFDNIALNRFFISRSKLPKESIIINNKNSLYEKYNLLINTILTIVAVLVLMIITLQIIIKRKTKEIEKSKKKMNEFVGIVAHDLRSPIGAILSYADLLEDEPEHLNDVIPHIKNLATKSINLVNDMLDISAIESGNVELKINEINLIKLFDHTLKEVNFLAKNKNIKLCHNLENDLFIRGDFNRLTQVLQNLTTNAIKFTNDFGLVELIAKEEGDNVEIYVNDNGVGIPDSIVPKLFDKQIRTSSTGTHGESGTGYGLPLVYDLIKRHGSELKVKSIKNKGTTFHFSLMKA